MNAGENTQQDIGAHAEEWIALNRDLFDGWLAQAQLTSRNCQPPGPAQLTGS